MHINKHYHWLLLVIISIVANGCSTLPANIYERTNHTYNADQISRIEHWQAKGKLGFKSPDGGGSASVTWLQANETYHITFRGPFLSGTTVVRGDHHMAEIQQNNTSTQLPPSELASQVIGLPIPIDQLHYWLKGLSAPQGDQISDVRYYLDGSLAGFMQSQWQLSFLAYQDTEMGRLPRKIIAEKGELNLKLVITKWNFLKIEKDVKQWR
ncbi:MAG: lipoprotein insertase outer membrane protein LolB [Porticoccaceae bacterium]|nr:lipoprotein insertase outer membrane protein LolB [Porticoccaceae bacterium]MDG1475270.1 lipoprotein insertase outer membrane protein LolB [Porticoccaceae bacterium]